jgi:hypothetical protein
MSPTTTVQTTETTVLINLNNAGIQGATGANAVVAVTSPITNSGTSGSATIGLNQNLLSLTKSQISDFTSGTVTSAGTAQQSGTAVYATTSGTAVYATTSGTAVSISGSITRSQVSDYATGTVANISGTVTQAQVTSLVTDLANRAILNAANTFTVGNQIVASQSDTVMPLVLRRASPTATASILEFQTSTGTAIATVDASGFGNFPAVSAGSAVNLGYATLSVTPTSISTVGAVIRAASGQTANLLSIQRSDLTEVMRVRNSGQIGIGSLITGTNFTINLDTVGGSANIGAVIRGAASQSADLQQWQSSAGGTVASILSNGVIKAAEIRTANTYGVLREVASGGNLYMVKATSAPANPGANIGTIYFRDGTTSGLKLVVRAGAAGAETTILDNIPV